MTVNDTWESGDSIIQRVAAYGDASLNSYGGCVWDDTGTSDGKPKFTFEQRPAITAYDYALRLADLADFQDDESDDELVNYVIVKYLDDKQMVRHRTPAINASLTDTTSIARYGQRDKLIDLGQASVDVADYVGERYLNYHKSPLHKSSFSLVGQITDARGMRWPANRVRAGQRVRILDYAGGITFVLGHTSYDAESGLLVMTPDLPRDDVAIYLAQREAGLSMWR